tara:strand:- start:734 stop:886 length:153 start_codon:yes stop_codon:yes gene_type:complete
MVNDSAVLSQLALNKKRNITVNKGVNKLTLRGKTKVNALLDAAATVLPSS